MICVAMEQRAIRFDRLQSIYLLNNLIVKVISGFDRKGFECNLYNVGRAFGEHWSGRCFRLRREGGRGIAWPIFGISFKEDPPVIFLSFDRDWCGGIFEGLAVKRAAKDIHVVAAHNSREARFELSPERFAEFAAAPFKRQRAILEEFFTSVMDAVSPYL
jgi:hypothetical protein